MAEVMLNVRDAYSSILLVIKLVKNFVDYLVWSEMHVYTGDPAILAKTPEHLIVFKELQCINSQSYCLLHMMRHH